MIAANIPIKNPSIKKGILITVLLVPTHRIISISFRLLKIVIFIVLLIKKAVTKTKPITITILAVLTTSKILTKSVIIDSPYLTKSTLSRFLIVVTVSLISLISFTLTI